eukprot:Amastigsp_a183498_17.p3 type:complete len:144 gc:universal Amastigsp_a183498_17:446-15(-)
MNTDARTNASTEILASPARPWVFPLSAASSPSVSSRTNALFGWPGKGRNHIQMPLVCDSSVAPSSKPRCSPKRRLRKNDLPVRALPKMDTTTSSMAAGTEASNRTASGLTEKRLSSYVIKTIGALSNEDAMLVQRALRTTDFE